MVKQLKAKVTLCGIMTGTPGFGFVAMPGSIPRAQNSNPTRPVFMRVISASLTQSYIYKANADVHRYLFSHI